MIAGVPSRCCCASSATRVERGDDDALARRVVAATMTAAGVSAPGRRASAPRRCRRGCASPCRARSAGRCAPAPPSRRRRRRRRMPVARITAWLIAANVAGIAGRGQPRKPRGHARDDAERDAGRASASASSPPRPNMNGSPPLSRSTRCAGARQLDQTVRRCRPAASTAGRRACRRIRAAPAAARAPARGDRPARRGRRRRPAQGRRAHRASAGRDRRARRRPARPARARTQAAIRAQRGERAPVGHLMSPRTLTACLLPRKRR